MLTVTGFTSDPRAGTPEPAPPAQTPPVKTSRRADLAQTSARDRNAAVQEVSLELPEITAGKLQLTLDEHTGRVVGQVIDRDSGKLLWQVPSDEMLRLIAATEKLLGPIFSTEV